MKNYYYIKFYFGNVNCSKFTPSINFLVSINDITYLRLDHSINHFKYVENGCSTLSNLVAEIIHRDKPMNEKFIDYTIQKISEESYNCLSLFEKEIKISLSESDKDLISSIKEILEIDKHIFEITRPVIINSNLILDELEKLYERRNYKMNSIKDRFFNDNIAKEYIENTLNNYESNSVLDRKIIVKNRLKSI